MTHSLLTFVRPCATCAFCTALALGVTVAAPSSRPATAAESARVGEGTPALPAFRTHEIATGLRGGYQVVAADLNRDGRPDLVAVASSIPELVWFENPSWERHVLASGLSGLINVAAEDLDSDGIPELALAHGFATTTARSAGIVSLLTHGADPEQPWSIREIDRVPTAHRLRWYEPDGLSQKWLINSPLIGAGVQAPEYRGDTPIHLYRPPEWRRETIPQTQQGVVHSVEPVRTPNGEAALVVAGFLGVTGYRFVAGAWTSMTMVAGDPSAWPQSGSSEASLGRIAGNRFLATIEPWHGGQVVVYREADGLRRNVIDGSLTDGHTMLVVDLDNDGRDEIVAGERGGARSLRVYAAGEDGSTWSRTMLDETMGAAGCAAADLNLDGRVDLACIATSSANLKWYENLGPR